MNGTLLIVATPIGNLEDITLRALRVLKEVDLIACEDTRKTRKLLSHYGIRQKRLVSFFEANERRRVPEIVDCLSQGKDVALVSNAGTPGISDPGYRLIEELAHLGDFPLSIVPGPCALVSSLVISGLPTDSFFFKGFLPRRPGRKKKELHSLKDYKATIIFYESPYRLKITLSDIREIFGERRVAVVKELTKKFERVYRGSASEVLEAIDNEKVLKGEYVIIVGK
ncbi:MAG: 16S rRNA (cytidine(1402)-2'-O)-methyltransferase [Candidatus Omnitrophica bacterium]|nr:16S rRNA (cytidine(1402)-2'-O)-methyltransferase [Candidatus Omnitrophota bacterium]